MNKNVRIGTALDALGSQRALEREERADSGQLHSPCAHKRTEEAILENAVGASIGILVEPKGSGSSVRLN